MRNRGPGGFAAALLALAAAGAWAASEARPGPGRHVAELCVATSPSAPPSCGPAQADVRANGTMSLRVDDVVYRLELHSSQVDIVVMHNLVQIDEFTVPYEWAGSTLRFNDGDRASRYEIRFTPGRR
jgi:hypothetical protein